MIEVLTVQLASYPVVSDRLFTDELGDALTYKISGGAAVKRSQTSLGHACAVITLRTYAHMWPEDEDRTRNVLGAALVQLGARADSSRTGAAPKG